MGFKNGSYATFWGPLNTSEYGAVSARISISYKSKRTGNYEQSFGGFVRFSNAAAEKVKTLKERDRIKLLETDLVNHYDANTKKMTWTPIIFDFEVLDDSGRPAATQPSAPPAKAPQSAPSPSADDNELPF